MYLKQKMTSTPQVDMEEQKRRLKRELLGDLKPILKAQGIQFPDIAGVMSEKECRSNLASTTRNGQPQGKFHIEAFPPLHSSLELDTIKNLAQPIACSLVVMIGGSF
jgi:hypothetical protein